MEEIVKMIRSIKDRLDAIEVDTKAMVRESQQIVKILEFENKRLKLENEALKEKVDDQAALIRKMSM